MLLAVTLQILGAVFVVAAAFLWFGLEAALVVAGVVLFAAGFAHERSI